MPIVELAGKQIKVDEDGFIQEPGKWDRSIAEALARAEGVELMTEDHWKLVEYIRDYYQRFGIAPMLRKVCKETGFNLKYVYQLFPSGPARGACKVAGLPKPTGCV